MPDAPEPYRSLEDLDAADAVVAAWTDGGVTMGWHRAAVADVRDTMPALAAALDRLAAQRPEHIGLHWRPPSEDER